MALAIDHIFIATQVNAPEAELLTAFGLSEGTPNQHVGQGTANRRFFFENTFLELLWITDVTEAQSELVKPTHLYERLNQQNPSISPFGICFRPTTQTDSAIPFPCWNYQPSYLPPHLSIPMASNNLLTEPLWFVLLFGAAPSSFNAEKRQPLEHTKGFKQLTSVRISQPSTANSLAAQQANQVAGFKIEQGETHLLELGFDGEQAGLSHDFRPSLPLIIKW